jgi:hypothetical protein
MSAKTIVRSGDRLESVPGNLNHERSRFGGEWEHYEDLIILAVAVLNDEMAHESRS